MPDSPSASQAGPARIRLIPAAGAVLAAAAVALSAYAAHASDGQAQARLQQAALMAFGHGIAVAALGLQVGARARWALVAMLGGALLFCGSLFLAHVLGSSTRLAPLGGALMIGSWLALAGLVATGRWRD